MIHNNGKIRTVIPFAFGIVGSIMAAMVLEIALTRLVIAVTATAFPEERPAGLGNEILQARFHPQLQLDSLQAYSIAASTAVPAAFRQADIRQSVIQVFDSGAPSSHTGFTDRRDDCQSPGILANYLVVIFGTAAGMLLANNDDMRQVISLAM